MSLIDFSDLNHYNKLTWFQVQALQTLQRNMFPNELYWKEDTHCAGFTVSDNPNCQLRTEEMSLVMYTPEECVNDQLPNCIQLVTYARISTSS